MTWASMALQARTPAKMDCLTNTMVAECARSMDRMADPVLLQHLPQRRGGILPMYPTAQETARMMGPAKGGRYLQVDALVQRLSELRSNIGFQGWDRPELSESHRELVLIACDIDELDVNPVGFPPWLAAMAAVLGLVVAITSDGVWRGSMLALAVAVACAGALTLYGRRRTLRTTASLRALLGDDPPSQDPDAHSTPAAARACTGRDMSPT